LVSFREGLKEPLHLPCGRIDEVVDKTSSIDSDEAIDDDICRQKQGFIELLARSDHKKMSKLTLFSTPISST